MNPHRTEQLHLVSSVVVFGERRDPTLQNWRTHKFVDIIRTDMSKRSPLDALAADVGDLTWGKKRYRQPLK